MSFIFGLITGVVGGLILVPLGVYILYKIKETKVRRKAKRDIKEGKFLTPIDEKDFNFEQWKDKINKEDMQKTLNKLGDILFKRGKYSTERGAIQDDEGINKLEQMQEKIDEQTDYNEGFKSDNQPQKSPLEYQKMQDEQSFDDIFENSQEYDEEDEGFINYQKQQEKEEKEKQLKDGDEIPNPDEVEFQDEDEEGYQDLKDYYEEDLDDYYGEDLNYDKEDKKEEDEDDNSNKSPEADIWKKR